MVPDPWLTIGEHSCANLFQNSPGLRIAFVQSIEEIVVDGHRDVRGPVLGGVSLTGDEIVNMRIVPREDAHSSRAPDPTRDHTLSNGMVDIHCIQRVEGSTLPVTLVQDLCRVDEHSCEWEWTGRCSAEPFQRCTLRSNPGYVEDDSLIGAFVVRVEGGFDEISESIRPSFPRVLDLMRAITSQRAQIFL